MTPFAALHEDELDELLQGQTPEGLADLAPVAAFAAALRERSDAQPTPPMSPTCATARDANATCSSDRTNARGLR